MSVVEGNAYSSIHNTGLMTREQAKHAFINAHNKEVDHLLRLKKEREEKNNEGKIIHYEHER